MAGLAVLQVTLLVISSVLPSLNVPVAASCRVVPSANVGFAGVIASEARTGDATVSVAVPLTAPEVALIVVVPLATPVAIPLLVIVAMVVRVEVHDAEVVRSCVLPSL